MFDYFDTLVVLAAGVVGFGLGGLSNSSNKHLRGIGWFFAGLAVGVIGAFIAPAFITIN